MGPSTTTSFSCLLLNRLQTTTQLQTLTFLQRKSSTSSGYFFLKHLRSQLCSHTRTNNFVAEPNSCTFPISERSARTSFNASYVLPCLLCPRAIHVGKIGNNTRQQIKGRDIRHHKNKPVMPDITTFLIFQCFWTFCELFTSISIKNNHL